MTTPDMSAETWLGAAAWAGGSQKWNGTSPAFTPNPASARQSTAPTAPAPRAGRAAPSAAKVQSAPPRPHTANIARSASVPAWVATR